MTQARSFVLLSFLICAAGVTDADVPSSADVLAFGEDDILFVGDSRQGVVYAYDLADDGRASKSDVAYNLLDLDATIVATLDAEPGSILYRDLAVHPVTRNAFVSVSYTNDGKERSSVVSVTRAGEVAELDLGALKSSSFTLNETADDAVTFWRDIPAPSLTITDLDYVKGELFVSGISTGEFASTLRKIPYPFSTVVTASSIEMYHAAHAQNETRAPIRAMTVIDLEGESVVVAAYTCTPLVTLPVDSLKDGAKVTGKTIAELGYGNTPLDVIAFSASDMQGKVSSYLLVVNREMAADLITFEEVSAAVAGNGLSSPVPYLGATAGVATTTLPLAGVMQAADQDNQFLLALRRNLDTGATELVSFRKGAFFRLSDFISEYNFPDYEYEDDEFSQGTRMFQNMLKSDEGYPDQAR
ncbi:MAG: hypothetical protein AAGA44_01225 [Pseudomonadota bacterium]